MTGTVMGRLGSRPSVHEGRRKPTNQKLLHASRHNKVCRLTVAIFLRSFGRFNNQTLLRNGKLKLYNGWMNHIGKVFQCNPKISEWYFFHIAPCGFILIYNWAIWIAPNFMTRVPNSLEIWLKFNKKCWTSSSRNCMFSSDSSFSVTSSSSSKFSESCMSTKWTGDKNQSTYQPHSTFVFF